MTRGERAAFSCFRGLKGAAVGEGRVCVHSRDRIREEEATKGRFCAVVKAAVLAALGNSEGRERGAGRERGKGNGV